jgi:hypothetical protein
VSVSTCGGLIHGWGEAYIREGAYIRRFTVTQLLSTCMLFCYVTASTSCAVFFHTLDDM